MANQEVGKVQALVNKLRVITRVVQITPFVYSFIFIISMTIYLFAKPGTLRFLDAMFYTSPAIIVFFLIMGRILKLCVWFRTACLLPVAPHICVFVDRYVWAFTRTVAFYNIIITTILFIIFLICAYKVFFAHGR